MAEFSVVKASGVHPTVGYSHAIRVGDLVYASGQVARDEQGTIVGQGDAGAQAEQIFKNIKAVLEAAGSGLDRVVKLTTFVTDLSYRPAVGAVRNRVFEPFNYYPPSTFLVVKGLAEPDYLVEIEAVAVVR